METLWRPGTLVLGCDDMTILGYFHTKCSGFANLRFLPIVHRLQNSHIRRLNLRFPCFTQVFSVIFALSRHVAQNDVAVNCQIMDRRMHGQIAMICV
jgi:hypothetical protein